MTRRFAPIALALALTSCGGGNLAPVAASLTPVALPPAQVKTLQQTCQVAGPLLNIASQANMPATVSETATYGASYCNQLLAGALPPTTDANTPSWLPKVIKGVQVAAGVAKVALPLVLPLL